MSAIKRVQQWATFTRTWHLFDANWQNPLEAANALNIYLRGLHKPIYHPTSDCGDHVVIINCRRVALPGNEWRRRVYFHHTTYPGGATWTPAWELHTRNPVMVMWKAVYHSMKNNIQRRHTMQRLHLYPDEEVPPEIKNRVTSVIRQLRPVPERLDHMPEKVIKEFPQIAVFPKDYVVPELKPAQPRPQKKK
ncbi:hypothetical protein B566_EDAN013956 [Ephemera danica]|nr:hypothetical protein B566_EDAN013956 [Ephemera danica]